MTDPSNNTTITIDLDFNDSNAKIDAQQLIQRRCYDNLKKRISDDIGKAKQQFDSNKGCRDRREYPFGSGLVYFIDGTRGAGKSTFLQSVFNALPTDIQKQEPLEKFNICCLAYIDPSRIEDNEIILLGILKALKEKALASSKACSQHGENNHKDFREHFKKLAGGLNLFARNHDQLQDLDAELFLEWGLERAGHSAELRKNLHVLLDLACQILNADALILAFDDADTNARHARNVLECIRKYLDTPRLVILVTGDIELYSLMVRAHFHNSLGKKKHPSGQERQEQMDKMIDHLEDQYLLKLFPVQRRVQLRPLWNMLEREPELYLVNYKKDGKLFEHKPVEVVDALIRQGLRIKNINDVNLYREFLLKQPLRSVLQVLSRCAPYLAPDLKSNAWTPDLSEALSEGLHALALGSLYKFGVDVDAIAANELSALITSVFDLAVRDGDFDTAAYLRPQPGDTDLRSCYVALAADVTRLCTGKPAALIDYMLAGPGSVTLCGVIFRRKGNNNLPEQAQKTLRRQFEQYMGIGRKENALNWARHAVAILVNPYRDNSKTPVVYSGIIGLRRKDYPGNEEYKSYLNALKTHTDFPAFALSLVRISGTNTRICASIYNILGLMARLLALESNRGKYNSLPVLSRLYPPLSVSQPQWESDTGAEDEEQNEYPGRRLKKLANEVNIWLKYFKEKYYNKINPSTVLIGKIWTRLYFSLERVCDAKRPKVNKGEENAASLMELFALCVINAFYVEERTHHLITTDNDSSSITDTYSNTLTSASDYITNHFKNIHKYRKSLPLTYLVATCPLLLGLLKITDENNIKNIVSELLDDFGYKNSIEDSLCPSELWDALNKIYIRGMEREKKTSIIINPYDK